MDAMSESTYVKRDEGDRKFNLPFEFDSWDQSEACLSGRADVQFLNGICPDRLERHSRAAGAA